MAESCDNAGVQRLAQLLVAALGLAAAGCGGEADPAGTPVEAVPAVERHAAPAPPPAPPPPPPPAQPAPAQPPAAPRAQPPPPPPAQPPAPPAPARDPCSPASFRPLDSRRIAYAAVARRALWVHRRPRGARVTRLARRTVNGVPTVLGVLARSSTRCKPAWYRVQVPKRPNGSTGYVRARDVAVAAVRTRIAVDLSARTVTLFRGGRKVLETRAAIGSDATPTPVGRFYVNQRLLAADPSGPFGPAALGISAFSDVLTGWTQGGPVAIHGTNRPWLIGKAVSNGCIRVRNDVLRRLFREALAGTPVVIRR